MKSVSYLFLPGRRSILAEVYLPRRIATQGTIYQALERGLTHSRVVEYLKKNVASLQSELIAYLHWFDPGRYGDRQDYPNALEAAEAHMEMYEQVFFGWSMYEVDGVFLKADGKTIDEERTQVIRLMFKFEQEEFERQARDAGHPETYRAILYWVLSEYGHTDNYRVWTKPERRRFLRRHPTWDKAKKEFAQELYVTLAPAVAKWIADCGLFIFGYLVRQFWDRIVELNLDRGAPLEDQIWVASIFHLNINVLAPKRS